MSQRSDTYSIRQIMDLTGLSEFTLRGWENRYRAFQPRRNETSRRIYSHRDLERAILLRELIARGQKISRIANLDVAKLQSLLEKNPTTPKPSSINPSPEIESILNPISLQKWNEAQEVIAKQLQKYAPRVFLLRIVLPLLGELGHRVEAGLISIAQEHIVTSLIKQALFVVKSKAKPPRKLSYLVFATPEGDIHELGILVATALAAHAGFSTVFMGPNTPKRELCETALRFGATHIVLSSTVSRKEGAREDLYTYLHFLNQNLDSKMAIWLGGRNKVGIADSFSREVNYFSSIEEFDERLKTLN